MVQTFLGVELGPVSHPYNFWLLMRTSLCSSNKTRLSPPICHCRSGTVQHKPQVCSCSAINLAQRHVLRTRGVERSLCSATGSLHTCMHPGAVHTQGRTPAPHYVLCLTPGLAGNKISCHPFCPSLSPRALPSPPPAPLVRSHGLIVHSPVLFKFKTLFFFFFFSQQGFKTGIT